MVDFDVVGRFQSIVEVGHVCISRQQNWRPASKYYLDQLAWFTGKRADVIKVLDLLMPYFGERRKKRSEEVYSRALGTPFEGWDAPRERRYELDALRRLGGAPDIGLD